MANLKVENVKNSPMFTGGPCDFYLDITSDVCPMTFVRTKLLIERMASGQTVEIRIAAGEALENVPRAVGEHGHRVLGIEATAPGSGIYLLRVRKA